jgi:hypothetical protein
MMVQCGEVLFGAIAHVAVKSVFGKFLGMG